MQTIKDKDNPAQGAEAADPLAARDARWRAVGKRDPRADGHFVFADLTTGIYCRPSCPARAPKRENVTFFETAAAAERAGFRACKRCRPNGIDPMSEIISKMHMACRQIEEAETDPSLRALASDAGLSPAHFNRTFKKIIGVTPKQYALAKRSRNLGEALRDPDTEVTAAIYDAGYSTGSRFYETAQARLGMRPGAYKSGGRGETIRYGSGRSTLGPALVAATAKGICAILFADDEDKLSADLKHLFPSANLERADRGSDFDRWIKITLAYIEQTQSDFPLPLDIRGTAFQERVWRALRRLTPGETVSYGELARRIGHPKAARAVAGACAANRIGVAIPCHRVIRNDGSLSGYRWGAGRKRVLLAREKQAKGRPVKTD